MTYNPLTPRATDRISDTQAPIQTNFSQANTIMGIDHFEYNNGNAGDRGMHKQSTYPTLPIAGAFPVPVPTPIAGTGCIYSKTVGAQTIPYYRKDAGVLDFPVLPLRAMGRFVTSPLPIVGNPIIAVGTPFNLAGVRLPDSGPPFNLFQIQFTFTQALPDANYLILPNFLSGGSANFTTILNTGFVARFIGTITDLCISVLHYL